MYDMCYMLSLTNIFYSKMIININTFYIQVLILVNSSWLQKYEKVII